MSCPVAHTRVIVGSPSAAQSGMLFMCLQTSLAEEKYAFLCEGDVRERKRRKGHEEACHL